MVSPTAGVQRRVRRETSPRRIRFGLPTKPGRRRPAPQAVAVAVQAAAAVAIQAAAAVAIQAAATVAVQAPTAAAVQTAAAVAAPMAAAVATPALRQLS